MKILIDLGHPAHIHYFKNFIWIMEGNGHEFLLVARDKEVLHDLLIDYSFPYINRGKGGNSLLFKLFYILKADFIIFKGAKRFKPDLFLSVSSTYAAHVSRLFRKPHIALDDTEHAIFELLMYPPFSDVILNPSPFWKRFSKKQIFFDSYLEMSHLLPKYFKPDPSVLASYDIDSNSRFFLLRLVSWNASHDVGQSGLDPALKREIVSKLEQFGQVFISSEEELSSDLKKYQIKIKPAHFHHFLYYASMYIGEGATTAAESIILGTPAIYINTLNAGTIKEQSEKYGLISLRDAKIIMEKIDILLHDTASIKASSNREKILNEKIDITSFLVWFIENYPESKIKMQDYPDYQHRFK